MERALNSRDSLCATSAPVDAASGGYGCWQHLQHVEAFDARSLLDGRSLVTSFEVYNDVRLLRQHLERHERTTVLEVGCAAGEFWRYLRIRHPRAEYYGIDVSVPAIARAKGKYPQGRFVATDASLDLSTVPALMGMPGRPQLVYSKDVVHHQPHPFGFLTQLLALAEDALIVRLRTRDYGPTEMDPEWSCQYHYRGWVPYIVANLDEVIEHVRAHAVDAEVVGYRSHVVLGGAHKRFLPKDCYLPETGTAETALGVFRHSGRAGRVAIEDRADGMLVRAWDTPVRSALRRIARSFRERRSSRGVVRSHR